MSDTDVLWSWGDPLARSKGETVKAYAAFCDYVELGPGRSITGLAQGYRGEADLDSPGYAVFKKYWQGTAHVLAAIPPTRRIRTLYTWSWDNRWQARLARHDQIQHERREEIREARRQELEDLDWNTGKELRQRARRILDELPRFLSTSSQEIEQEDGSRVRIVTVKMNASLSQLSIALKAASDLQRLSIDEPTEIREVYGAALLSQLAAALDELAETMTVSD